MHNPARDGFVKWRLAALYLSCLIPAGNFPALAGDPQPPIAVVRGLPLSEKDLPPAAQAALIQLRFQEYQLLRGALEEAIDRRLLAAEAGKRGLSPEVLLQLEVDSKVPAARVKEARTLFFHRLRTAAGVVILLNPPRVWISPDSARTKGNPEAPVTISMFLDYQCPRSRQMHFLLEQLQDRYSDLVRLAYFDFPQPDTNIAAQAARCAGEQGQFWDYQELLFANARPFHPAGLVDQARQIDLDTDSFAACLNGGRFRAAVEADLQTGKRFSVTETPAIFVNGIPAGLSHQESTIRTIIEEELSRLGVLR